MSSVFYVFIGGGLGSVARFLLASFVQRALPGAFPFGTLTVNCIGCCVIGMLWGISGKGAPGFPLSVFLFAGVLGGFTTFSSFGLETFALIHDGAWPLAAVYVLLTNLLGLLLTFAGYTLMVR